MIRVNFNTYNNYVTDSVYQWDKNRDLVITGLYLSIAPEIHFANASMGRAIVKESTLEDGVVTVRIPNSILREALTIKAYVGLYEGESFKVIETIEIPVIAKTKPEDYTIETSDGEVYSFIALERKLDNAIAELVEKNKTVYDDTIEDLIAENERIYVDTVNRLIGDIDKALDGIIEIQTSLIGGDGE